jgi:hypothetical protein
VDIWKDEVLLIWDLNKYNTIWKTIFFISEEDFSDTMMLNNEEKFGIAIQHRYMCICFQSKGK